VKPRTVTGRDLGRIEDAITCLRRARQLLAESEAHKAVAKVRSALKSAEGARRHTEGLLSRLVREYQSRKTGARPEVQS
jgi:hypothetical protein